MFPLRKLSRERYFDEPDASRSDRAGHSSTHAYVRIRRGYHAPGDRQPDGVCPLCLQTAWIDADGVTVATHARRQTSTVKATKAKLRRVVTKVEMMIIALPSWPNRPSYSSG